MTFLLCRHCQTQIRGDRIIRTKMQGSSEFTFSYHFDCFFQWKILSQKENQKAEFDLEIHGAD